MITPLTSVVQDQIVTQDRLVTVAQRSLLEAGITLNSLEWRGRFASMSDHQKRLFDRSISLREKSPVKEDK